MRKSLVVVSVILALPVLGALLWLGSDDSAPPRGAGAPSAADTSAPAAAMEAPTSLDAGAAANETARPPARTEMLSPRATPGPALLGRVVDERGTPVVEATVLCWQQPTESARSRSDTGGTVDLHRIETTTGGDGRFRVDAPPIGTVQVQVRARGYQLLDTGAVTEDEDVDLGTLTLARGAIVSGRVLDRSGRPVVGARVDRRIQGAPEWADTLQVAGGPRRDPEGGREARTGDAGAFELAHVTPGDVTLRVRHADHPIGYSEPFSLAAGQVLRDVTIVLDAGAEIRGRVTGLPDGITGVHVLAMRNRQPHRGADTSGAAAVFEAVVGDSSDFFAEAGLPVGERAVAVDADGGFTLAGLVPAQTYRIWAVQKGEGFVEASTCTERHEVAAGARGVELPYLAGVSVHFEVVDDATGAPVERLWVGHRLVGGGLFASVFASITQSKREQDYPGGVVTIANVRPRRNQKLEVTVEARGHAELQRGDIELPERGGVDLGVLRLRPAPVVEVEVVTAADGKPVAGATVELFEPAPERDGGSHGSITVSHTVSGYGDDDEQPVMPAPGGPRSARTDEHGRCQLNGLPGKTVGIAVDSGTLAPYRSDPIALPAQGTVEHRAELMQGGLVAVMVVTPSGEPVAGVGVLHHGADGAQGTEKTGADGVARFERLLAGSHRFELAPRSPWAGLTITTRVDEDEPDTAGQPVELAEGAYVELTLVKQPGASLTGVVRENGAPLSGAHVRVLPGTESSAADDLSWQVAGRLEGLLGGSSTSDDTDGNGRYEIDDLDAGPCRLQVTHEDRAMPSVVPTTLIAGANVVDVDLDLTVLHGTVRDEGGAPISRARLTVELAPPEEDGEWSGSGSRVVGGVMSAMASFGEGLGLDLHGDAASSYDDGTFELYGVRPGVRLVVRASAPGYVGSSSEPVQVEAGGERGGVDIEMAAAGKIEVRVDGTALFAMATATFQGENEAPTPPIMSMLRSGRATLDGLRPGPWKVEVDLHDDVERTPQTVQVIAGRSVDLQF